MTASQPAVRGPAPDLLAVVILYLAVAFWLLPAYRHQINPDGVGYLSVAGKYLHGYFAEAVNGYWSPLLSWLLIPLLAAGIAPLLTTKLVAVAIGLATILAAWGVLLNLGVRSNLRFLVGVALIPVVLNLGLTVITPDLLVCCTLLLYLLQMTNPRYADHWYSGVVSGALGVLAYLAKAYALPLILAHFVIVGLANVIRDPRRRRRHLVLLVTGVASLALFCAPWVIMLSFKFDAVMTGSAGRYNHALNGPASRGQFTQTQGFLPPSDPYAVSAWDDPTYAQYTGWSPFDSYELRQYQFKLWERNIAQTRKLLSEATWLLYPLLLVSLLLAGSRLDFQPRRPLAILICMLWLYPIGYWSLHVLDRFLAPMVILLLILGAAAVQAATMSRFWSGWERGWIPGAVLCGSFIYTPVTELDKHRNTGEHLLPVIQTLADVIPPGSRVASNRRWADSLFVSFHLGLRYYGENPKLIGQTMLDELEKHQVEFFFVWGSASPYPFVHHLQEVAAEPMPGVRVFRLPVSFRSEASCNLMRSFA